MQTSDEAAPPADADQPIESVRRQRTRNRLMDAGYEVFAEVGVSAASVEMIAERAGFTRGAFYSNFESKDELFFAIQDRETTARHERMQYGLDAVLPNLTPAERDFSTMSIDRIVSQYLDLEPDDRKWLLIEAEFRLIAMRNPLVAPRYLEQQAAYLSQIQQVLERTTEQVGLRFTISIDQVSQVVSALNEAAVQHAILTGVPSYDGPARAEMLRTLSATIGAIVVRA